MPGELPRLTALFIGITPLAILAASLHLLSGPDTRTFFVWLTQENKPVELISFAALLFAGLVGLGLCLHLRRLGHDPFQVGFIGVFSLGLLFVAMEEVSWGQWFLGFDTPDVWREVNRQGETNLHNIRIINQLFELLRVAFGLGGLVSIGLRQHARFRLIAAPAMLAPWFLVIAALAGLDVVNIFVKPEYRGLLLSTAAMLVEVLEMLIGLAALLYMLLARRAALQFLERCLEPASHHGITA